MAELIRICAQAATTLDLAITVSTVVGCAGAALTGAGVWGIVRHRRARVR